jgi:hypothetical protein
VPWLMSCCALVTCISGGNIAACTSLHMATRCTCTTNGMCKGRYFHAACCCGSKMRMYWCSSTPAYVGATLCHAHSLLLLTSMFDEFQGCRSLTCFLSCVPGSSCWIFAIMLHVVSCPGGLRVLVSVCVNEACKQGVPVWPSVL